MLDIVVGTESNLTRNSIVFKSSFIEIEISKIVAKHSKPGKPIEQGNLIEQASRSNRLFDRAAARSGMLFDQLTPFHFWKPINRAVLVKLSTFGKALTDQPSILAISQISLKPVSILLQSLYVFDP